MHIDLALRPSFSPGASAHVTVKACDLCSIWISTGVAHELHDLRRVHELLGASLQTFIQLQTCAQEKTMIYHEQTLTAETLALLKLWADAYNLAIRQRNEKQNSNLLILVQPEVDVFVHHWLGVLTEYASLTLPKEFGGHAGVPTDGHFYLAESNLECVRRLQQTAWGSILQATTQWLLEHQFELAPSSNPPKLDGYDRQGAFATQFLMSTATLCQRMSHRKKEDLFAMLLGK